MLHSFATVDRKSGARVVFGVFLGVSALSCRAPRVGGMHPQSALMPPSVVTAILSERGADVVDSAALVRAALWSDREFRELKPLLPRNVAAVVPTQYSPCTRLRGPRCIALEVFGVQLSAPGHARVFAFWRQIGRCGGYVGDLVIRYNPRPVRVVSDIPYGGGDCAAEPPDTSSWTPSHRGR